MNRETPDNETGSLLALAGMSLLVGAVAGLVGAVFRLCLERADDFRTAIVGWAHGFGIAGMVLVVALCAAATAIAAWLVRRFSPHASGSGIPHVEAVLKQELPLARYRLIPVKFVGGLLAIGSGLALGREGPSVQIGASLAQLLAAIFRRNWADTRVLIAAGAGAGLATAFNAPIAGAIFVLEELVRRFETRIAIAALGASAAAMSVARLFLGDYPDFQVAALPYPGTQSRALLLVLGIVAGVAGVFYNRTILAAIGVADRIGRWPVELRAAIIGAGVGALAWFWPNLVGGGEALTRETLAGTLGLGVLPAVFALRFLLGPVSYAARTPGGLFAPLLALGAQLGVLFGAICHAAIPGLDMSPTGFAVVGMAAFFTSVVRAPITGIILIVEMTGSFTMLLPALGACFTAMLVPTLLANEPIYDSLRETRQLP